MKTITLKHFNKILKRIILTRKLKAESKLVKKESLKVLREFERL